MLPIVFGVRAFLRDGRIAPSTRVGRLYLLGMVASIVTSFGLSSTGGFNPGHALGSGEHIATVFVTDGAGNTSPTSSRSFTVDTVAPQTPTLVTPAEGAMLTEGTPSFSGLAEAGSTVKIWVDHAEAGTVTADSAGAWSFTPSAPLADGSHTAQAAATDRAGNTSPTSPPRAFTVEPARGCGCAGSPPNAGTGSWGLLLLGLWRLRRSRHASSDLKRTG